MDTPNLPLNCPSCHQALQVTHMFCPQCATKIEGNYILPKILKLSEQEQQFMIDYLCNNGSPSRLSKVYNLSYPAIRSRLDKLIEKLQSL